MRKIAINQFNVCIIRTPLKMFMRGRKQIGTLDLHNFHLFVVVAEMPAQIIISEG